MIIVSSLRFSKVLEYMSATFLWPWRFLSAVLIDFLDDIINSHVGGRKMQAICKLSFFRILMFLQTSATTCKAHDFYYSIKINARDKRRHKCLFL